MSLNVILSFNLPNRELFPSHILGDTTANNDTFFTVAIMNLISDEEAQS